jgi:hypothetical protein
MGLGVAQRDAHQDALLALPAAGRALDVGQVVVADRLELKVGIAGEQAEGEDGEGGRAARPGEEYYEEEDGGDDAES